MTSLCLVSGPDSSSAIEFSLREDKVSALIVGSKDFIVAVVQQLAWLGATCGVKPHQSSSPSRDPYYCETVWKQDMSSKNTYEISYDIVPLDEDETVPHWALLLDSPRIACGYPISERFSNEMGLKLPVEFLDAEPQDANIWSSYEDVPAGSTTNCYIDSVTSYDLKKMLQDMKQLSMTALEVYLKDLKTFHSADLFRRTLTRLYRTYKSAKSPNEQRCYSHQLRNTTAELLDTDPSSIELNDHHKSVWADTFKHNFQLWTKEEWDWWPLTPPRRPLLVGEARLYWTCVIGNLRISVANPLILTFCRTVGIEDGQKFLLVSQQK